MIEILLEAERALMAGRLDQAQRLYDQAVTADPRNSIAVVGLARVALERGDERRAHGLARDALSIDAENVAARRMATRLEEVFATRGEPLDVAADAPGVETPAVESPAVQSPAVESRAAGPGRRRGLLGRWFGRR
jgi:thioredoxin-like negative regulator of GroEL